MTIGLAPQRISPPGTFYWQQWGVIIRMWGFTAAADGDNGGGSDGDTQRDHLLHSAVSTWASKAETAFSERENKGVGRLDRG